MAALLEHATGLSVLVDQPVDVSGKCERLDLDFIEIGLYVELDPLKLIRSETVAEARSGAIARSLGPWLRPGSTP